MRNLSLLFILIFFGCGPRKQPKELVRFVNDQNDGFDAFNISIYNDSTYKKDASLFVEDIETGDYTMSEKIIYFKTGKLKGEKIVFDKDSSGCIYKPQLIYPNHESPLNMRVIFDSVFCPTSMRSKQR